MAEELLELPKWAAFYLAIGELDTVLQENEDALNDPSTTAEQRHDITFQAMRQYWDAFLIHREIKKAESGYNEILNAGHQSSTEQTTTLVMTSSVRFDLLRTAARNPILGSLPPDQTELKGVIPIRSQVVFWLVAALFVGVSQLDFNARSSHVALTACAYLALWTRKLLEKLDVRICVYWFTLYGIVTTAATYLGTILDHVSSILHTHRQIVVLHWCLAFFVISEADWWNQLLFTSEYPINCDMKPHGNSGDMGVLQKCATTLLHALFTVVTTRTLIGGLRLVGSMPGDWSGRGFYGSSGSSASNWAGQIPQAVIFLQPIRHLTAWVTNTVFELGPRAWVYAKERYYRRNEPSV